MQLLDVLVCNSANKPSFSNLTKSHVAQCSLDGKSAVTQEPFLDFEKMVY